MKLKILFFLLGGIFFFSCQKMERPDLGDYPKDPPPPPYSILKSYWTFDGNARDTGQYRLQTTVKNVTYVDGVKGQAAKIGEGGYIVAPAVDDSLKTPGSLTVAFWMNAADVVQGGAQGLFALGNAKQFWGNFEMFLENLNEADTGLIKLHMYNSGAPDQKGEQWVEKKIPKLLKKWSHVAVTYNAATSTLKMYADGAVVDERQLSGGQYGPLIWKDFTGLALGTFAFQTDPNLSNHGPETWAKSFNGLLDNVRIYNVAISDAEVKKLFDGKE